MIKALPLIVYAILALAIYLIGTHLEKDEM